MNQSIYQFREAGDQQRDDREHKSVAKRNRPAADNHGVNPEILAQAQLLNENAGWPRLVIEARLLAAQSPQEIETATGVPADVIEAFAEMYFPHVDLLGVPMFIFRAAIPARPDDFDQTLAPFLRLAAYGGGLAPLEATLRVLGPNAENLSAKKVDPSIRQELKRIRGAIRLYEQDAPAGVRRLLKMRPRRAPRSLLGASSNRGNSASRRYGSTKGLEPMIDWMRMR